MNVPRIMKGYLDLVRTRRSNPDHRLGGMDALSGPPPLVVSDQPVPRAGRSGTVCEL